MPLSAEIKINGNLINTIHIGRFAGDTNPDSINTYRALWSFNPEPNFTNERWRQGVEFTHRYGDGAEVCVMKALEQLKHEGRL